MFFFAIMALYALFVLYKIRTENPEYGKTRRFILIGNLENLTLVDFSNTSIQIHSNTTSGYTHSDGLTPSHTSELLQEHHIIEEKNAPLTQNIRFAYGAKNTVLISLHRKITNFFVNH